MYYPVSWQSWSVAVQFENSQVQILPCLLNFLSLLQNSKKRGAIGYKDLSISSWLCAWLLESKFSPFFFFFFFFPPRQTDSYYIHLPCSYLARFGSLATRIFCVISLAAAGKGRPRIKCRQLFTIRDRYRTAFTAHAIDCHYKPSSVLNTPTPKNVRYKGFVM